VGDFALGQQYRAISSAFVAGSYFSTYTGFTTHDRASAVRFWYVAMELSVAQTIAIIRRSRLHQAMQIAESYTQLSERVM